MAETAIDELFDVKPAEFVAARDSLAKRLRAEGQRDEANKVSMMRRPSVVVWALNQLARRDSIAVDALLAAGEAVHDAQLEGSGSRLRDARKELQSHVSALTRQGTELLESEQVSGPSRAAELGTALKAAALSGDPSDRLRVGRLLYAPEAPSGLEMWSAGQSTAATADQIVPDSAQHDLENAAERQREAEEALAKARGRASRLAGRVKELEARLEQERAALRDADSAVAAAEAHSRQVTRELARLRARRQRRTKTD